MSRIFLDDEYDDDDLYEDEDDDDDDDDEDDDDEDMDVLDQLEYYDTNQIQTREEIRSDIRAYLKRFQPKYKIVRIKD